MANSDGATALRGRLLWFTHDPFLNPPGDCFTYHEDGILVMRDGRVAAAGPAEEIADELPEGIALADYSGYLILPGFIDSHIHYTQTQIIGADRAPLLRWLEECAFPAEADFASPDHAARIAGFFCDELLRNGTTSAMVFCSTHPASVDAIFEAGSKRQMRLIAGKVMMDCHGPEALLETPADSIESSRALAERWHGVGRCSYALTPRFAPSCTPDLLQAAGELRRDMPDLFVQSHVAENREEIEWVRELFRDRAGYLDIYDHYALLGRRSIFAHGIHLEEAEWQRLYDTDTAIAHCPGSNFFLGSGLFDFATAKRSDRPVHVGLGTDVGGGDSFSQLRSMSDARKTARLRDTEFGAEHGFYLATLGNARALGLEGELGTLAPGADADLVILDSRATPLMDLRMDRAETIEEELAILMNLGDDRAVRAAYTAGACAYDRDAAAPSGQ